MTNNPYLTDPAKLDELEALERRMRDAELPWAQSIAKDDYNDALRNAAPDLIAAVRELRAALEKYADKASWRMTTMHGVDDDWDAYAWSPEPLGDLLPNGEPHLPDHFHEPWMIASAALAPQASTEKPLAKP